MKIRLNLAFFRSKRIGLLASAERFVDSNISAVLWVMFLGLMLFNVKADAHAQTYSLGNPVVGSPAGGSNLVSSPFLLDASQFSGADMCAQINTAYQSSQFTGSIDATAFSGVQACNSNPFDGMDVPVHLYLNPDGWPTFTFCVKVGKRVCTSQLLIS